MVIRFRIAQNKWNLQAKPWSGAVGIERVEYHGDSSFNCDNEVLSVPSLVCWFMRSDDNDALAQQVVDLLNERTGPS